MTYNGWTNYETWLTNLYFDDFTSLFEEMTEEGIFDEMDDDAITQYVANYLQEYIDDYISDRYLASCTDNFIVDVIQTFMNEVDWRDIAQHYVADIIADVAIRNKDKEAA